MRLAIDPCPLATSEQLAEVLGVSRVLADVLVRRGLADPVAARTYLDLRGSLHDPLELGDMAEAVALIGDAIAAQVPIVVHGDYDADGICATALACSVIEALGGTVAPFLPSRFDEGYGLAVETVERLAAEGCELLVTVDCGITAVDAAARAAELGLSLVITDHHRAGPDLPACPIVAPHGRRDYPAELCGTGVAYKLAEALVAAAGADPAIATRELDLVALATVADVVPLVGENRALVRSGLEMLRRTARPGLDALMRVAKVDRHAIGSTEIGFRLAPRINAAGRLGHPREALELLTTTDERRGRELAELLDNRNRERQAVEAEILRDALAQAAALPPERRDAPAIVLASADWHVGVIGIVASRVVERLRRPAVLIALDGAEGRGSGRSIPTFDLHAALGACSDHLLAYGGHAAAAGLTIRTDAVEAFAAAFGEHAATVLGEGDLAPAETIDAVVSLADVSLELADELRLLEPHGLGNPNVRLLLPAVELAGIATLGQDGKHLRFTARSSAGTCRTVMWGAGGELARLSEGGRFDLIARVERNDWNGTSTAQLTARTVSPVRDGADPVVDAWPGDDGDAPAEVSVASPRRVLDRRGRGAYAELARLAATGEGLLVVCGDVARRRAMLRGALHPERFGLRGALVFGARSPAAAVLAGAASVAGRPVLALTDYATLPEVAGAFSHVAVLDPPSSPGEQAAIAALAGNVHLVWGATEQAIADRARAARAPRELCAAVWRALGDAARSVAELAEPSEATPYPPFPDEVAFAVGVLSAAGLLVPAGDDRFQRADPAPRADLTTIAAFAERERSYRSLSAVDDSRRDDQITLPSPELAPAAS